LATPDPTPASGVAGLHEILQLVEDDLVRVETLFESEIRSDVRLVGEIARYIRDGGGKRIRPALLLLARRLFGAPDQRAIVLAGVVEFIHTATLLHDDIIDQATVRRGRRSVNSRWGNDVTVLAGDFLYTKSMAMALSQDNLEILRVLSDVTLRMTEGELLEIETCAELDIDAETHLDIIGRKTADLFSACTRIAGLLAGASEGQVAALARYGWNLGICFQMVDDLLDFTADEAVLGKPVCNDLREGRLTLPAIFLVRRRGDAARALLAGVIEDRGFGRVSREEIVAATRESGALQEARELAERYAEAARRDLDGFELSPYREALAALPDFILARDR
jgi:octaprenyl-diphosphate synthase